MTSVFSWQHSISLCPASFRIPRPNLPVTPGVSWLPTFAFQSPIMKRTSFLVLVLKGLVGLHRTVQLQLLQRYRLGHRLGWLWYWMVCLGNEHRWCCERAALNMPANLKTQQWPQDWNRSLFITIPKKGNAKECSNYRTIALISHASKIMLKILQARLQQYMNRELPDVQAGFRKGRGTRD